MRSGKLSALVAVAFAALALAATAVLAATPKDGTFAGETEVSGKKISIRVKSDGDKAVVKYCNYSMPSAIKKGDFKAAYNGPGGTYVAVKGSFPTKKTAKGTVTTDFLCNTEGEKFTAKLK